MMQKYKNQAGYTFDVSKHRWVSTQGQSFSLGHVVNTTDENWKVDTGLLWRTQYNDKPIEKFSVHGKTKDIVLNPQGTQHAHTFDRGTFDEYIRCFYDAKNNAVGIRTPHVEGVVEYGWTDDITKKAFDMQFKLADWFYKQDSTLKIAINIGNQNLRPGEKFDWELVQSTQKLYPIQKSTKTLTTQYNAIPEKTRVALLKELYNMGESMGANPHIVPTASMVVGVYHKYKQR